MIFSQVVCGIMVVISEGVRLDCILWYAAALVDSRVCLMA